MAQSLEDCAMEECAMEQCATEECAMEECAMEQCAMEECAMCAMEDGTPLALVIIAAGIPTKDHLFA